MQCSVCGSAVPDGRRSCPNCGRVFTKLDFERDEAQKSNLQKNPAKITDKTAVYRPAAAKKPGSIEDQTIHIKSIFSTGPDAPEYTDKHKYDRATKDILEYDRMFLSGNKNDDIDDNANDDDSDIKIFESGPSYAPDLNPVYENNETDDAVDDFDYPPSDDEDEDSDTRRGAVVRDKQYAKPHFHPNIKSMFIAMCVIAGLLVIILGVYKVGSAVGFWGNKTADEASSVPQTENSSNSAPVTIEDLATFSAGVYTVTSDKDNVALFNSTSDNNVTIASVPNGTVIDIISINGIYGKTIYNKYTGWILLSELEYTPSLSSNATTTNSADGETTTASSNDNANNSDNDNNDDNNSDSNSGEVTSPGTYTVDLKGEGGSGLNIRENADSESTALDIIPEGTKVTIDEIDGNWGHLSYNSLEGWVYIHYLR